ncbi:hypothetical protein EDB92DRAFT_1864201 [Lactarius akahatsu]|uniref:Uncharacterized protein n=1 Tax=Lactarius akahatsu TaxID=416441 RepID=A0AAD4QDA2_9AGAM|nr:hypothetical protein EDB92DRAFT_1864201 [Lactarius akahatsu]
MTPQRVLHIYISRRIVRRTHRSRMVASPSCRCHLLKEQYYPHRRMAEIAVPCLQVPFVSLRHPPTCSLRPSHFYFDLTASLVTHRRTLVLYTHSGTEERRETDGRTRKVRVVTVGRCVRVLFTQSDPNLGECQRTLACHQTPKSKGYYRFVRKAPPPYKATDQDTAPHLDGLGQSHLKNSTRAASTSGDPTRFSRGPAGPGHNAPTAFSPLKLLTPLSAPIHFCPNKTPVNLGDDSSFVIRGGIGEPLRRLKTVAIAPVPVASPNLKASWKRHQALSSAFFISASEFYSICLLSAKNGNQLNQVCGRLHVRSRARGVASTRKTISQVTGTPLLRTRDRSTEFLMSAADAAPGSVLFSQSTFQAYCR